MLLKAFTSEIFVHTVFTLEIEPPTKFTFVILLATTSISETASCKSFAVSITFAISVATVFTLAILVATVFILVLLDARVAIPDIPATRLMFVLSVGDNQVFSR